MAGEVVEIVNEVWPYAVAALSVYGDAVLKGSGEATADATVGWGRRLLQRIFGTGDAPEALTDVVVAPDDEDLQAALRVQIRKALADEEVRAAVTEILAEASGDVPATTVTNTVSHSTIEGANVQIGTVGRNVTIEQG
jgi:hypothetical protein